MGLGAKVELPLCDFKDVTLVVHRETLLIPLYCKFLEVQRQDGLLKDDKVVEIVQQLNCDFNKFASSNTWSSQVGVAVRTKILDQATRAFLSGNPYAVVVNLGAGLCTRFWRVDNGSVRWFELDLPEVKQVWSQVFTETDRHRYLTYSILDFDWIDELRPLRDSPFLFIAEGLFMYFEPQAVKRVIAEVQLYFPQSEMLIDAISPLIAKRTKQHPQVSKTDAVFKWGINTGQELETWNQNIHFIQEWYYLDQHGDRWRWMKWMRYIPPLRKAFKIMHIRFN